MLKQLVNATRGRPRKNMGESHRWDAVGGAEGYVNAVNTLGDDYQEMEKKGSSTKDVHGIWGRIADALSLENHDEDTRKWLKLVWKNDRRKVRTTFYATKIREIQSATDCDENMNISGSKSVTNSRRSSSNSPSQKSSSASSSSSSPSPHTSRTRRCKTGSSSLVPITTLFFALTYDEWKMFFDARPNHWKLDSDWTNKLNKYLEGINITCTLVFHYHHVKLHESRKRKSALFRCIAHCKILGCPVIVSVKVKNLPEKNEQTIFYVEKIGIEQHNTSDKTVGRQLTGKEREIQAQLANAIGSLKTYEANVREANRELLAAGNYSFVPSIDTIRKAKSDYEKEHRFDQDPVKDLDIFRHALVSSDTTSKKVKGYIHTLQHIPFAVHCTSEALVLRYYRYCKNATYSYINIDATGSVVRKIGNECPPFYYVLVFKDGDDPSNLIPLAVGLLSDHTTGGISTFLLTVRKIMLKVKTTYQTPSFFVCDFSLAIINALLMTFNCEDMENHLKRCWSILHKEYSWLELRSSAIIRVCCAHVMHAFVRSLHNMKLKKGERHQCTKLFAVLLNTDTLEDAFSLFEKFLIIYGDANASNTDKLLSPIVGVTNVLHFDLQEFLKDEFESAEESVTPPIEDAFASSKATIHCSPFTCEARKRFPLLERILKEKKDDVNTTINPHYSRNIIVTLYRWFAYLPLWTCIMSEYYDRYAYDKASSSNNSMLGRGCISNAPAETHFSTVKQSLLQGRLHLRPMEFLSRIHESTMARLAAGDLELPQTTRCRKLTKTKDSDVLQIDHWRRKGIQKAKGHVRGKYFSSVKEKKDVIDSERSTQSKNDTNSDEEDENSLLIPRHATNTTAGIHENKYITTDQQRTKDKAMKPSKMVTFDDDDSSDSSFGYAKFTKNNEEKPADNEYSPITNLNDDRFNYTTSMLDPEVTETMLPKEELSKANTRPVRQRIPNRQLDSYFVPSIRSNSSTRKSQLSLSSTSSLNCSESSKGVDAKLSLIKSDLNKRKPLESIENNPKKPKDSQEKIVEPSQRFGTASIGNVTLIWPHYSIKSTMFNGIVYTIINTCAVDSALFVYYFIWKTASTFIKNLFNIRSEPIYKIFNKTMQLVDSNGWNSARLYWLTVNNRIPVDTDAAQSKTPQHHDIFGTVDTNVYQYLRAMQTSVFSSECSARDCPNRKQNRNSTEIILSASPDNTFPDFIDKFAGITLSSCGVAISQDKPTSYNGEYWLDKKFPLRDPETNNEQTVAMYCCDSVKTLSISKFIEVPPIIIVQISPRTQVFMLPDILHVGDHKYLFRAAVCGASEHFTATVKHEDQYYKFDDTHYKGVFKYDSADVAETAIYSIICED